MLHCTYLASRAPTSRSVTARTFHSNMLNPDQTNPYKDFEMMAYSLSDDAVK